MSIDVADLNRDGNDDFVVVEMLSRDHLRRLTQRNIVAAELAPASAITGRPQYPRNTLFLNRGDGTYAEIAQYAGLEASEWSWAPIFLDVDLDGFEDLLVANGFERDNMNVDVQNRINRRNPPAGCVSGRAAFAQDVPAVATENLAFRNNGHLLLRARQSGGLQRHDHFQGVCLADLDNDGDLDVVINNMNAAAGMYRNDCVGARVGVRLEGVAPNTRGIGAKIRVFGGAVPWQSQEMIGGGRYLSGDDSMRVFAAGGVTNVMRIEVRWRSGKQSVIANAEANRIYDIDETAAVPVGQAGSSALRGTLFETSAIF